MVRDKEALGVVLREVRGETGLGEVDNGTSTAVIICQVQLQHLKHYILLPRRVP